MEPLALTIFAGCCWLAALTALLSCVVAAQETGRDGLLLRANPADPWRVETIRSSPGEASIRLKNNQLYAEIRARAARSGDVYIVYNVHVPSATLRSRPAEDLSGMPDNAQPPFSVTVDATSVHAAETGSEPACHAGGTALTHLPFQR